jgi:hypothetical protein
MMSLATEDGVHTYDRTTTLHGTPTAIQTQFKVRLWRDVCSPPSSELTSLVCGSLDPSALWRPEPLKMVCTLRPHYTTARHPNRSSNAIQTQFKVRLWRDVCGPKQ